MERSIALQDDPPVSHERSRLCQLCKPIFTAISPVKDSKCLSGSHHKNIESLRSAVDAGCYVCIRMWRLLCDDTTTGKPMSQFTVQHHVRNFSSLGFEVWFDAQYNDEFGDRVVIYALEKRGEWLFIGSRVILCHPCVLTDMAYLVDYTYIHSCDRVWNASDAPSEHKVDTSP
jgi:hypothetical protein